MRLIYDFILLSMFEFISFMSFYLNSFHFTSMCQSNCLTFNIWKNYNFKLQYNKLLLLYLLIQSKLFFFEILKAWMSKVCWKNFILALQTKWFHIKSVCVLIHSLSLFSIHLSIIAIIECHTYYLNRYKIVFFNYSSMSVRLSAWYLHVFLLFNVQIAIFQTLWWNLSHWYIFALDLRLLRMDSVG